MNDIEHRARLFAAEIHRKNTKAIQEIMDADGHVNCLDVIPILNVNLDVARHFCTHLQQHAELCDRASQKTLNPIERAKLAVTYASLYPFIGDEGIKQLSAGRLATKPRRQARGS